MASKARKRPSLLQPSLFAATWHAAVWGGLATLALALPHLNLGSIKSPQVLVALAAATVITELRPVVLPGKDTNGIVASYAFVMAVMYIYGFPIAAVIIAVSTLLSEVVERRELWKVVFNIGQHVLCLLAAWGVMLIAGQSPSASTPTTTVGSGDVLWMAATWIVFFAANHLLIVGVSADSARTLREALTEDLAYYFLTLMAVLALSPIIANVTLDAWPFIILLLLPLIAVTKAAEISRDRDFASRHDPLTGLTNRSAVAEELHDAIDIASRTDGRVGVMMMDLNRFKEVNDTFGHAAGDRLIIAAAKRIASQVRPNDVAARLGGDEFAVVLPGLPDYERGLKVANRIRSAIRRPFNISNESLDIDISIGIALYPDDGDSVAVLLEAADAAMYRAKSTGTFIEVVGHGAGQQTERRDPVASAAAQLDSGAFSLRYRPVVSATDFAVLAMSVEIDWANPAANAVPLDHMVAMPGGAALVSRLTLPVIERALTDAARWRAAGHSFAIRVPVTWRQLRTSYFAQSFTHALESHGLPGSAVILDVLDEIPEAELLSDSTASAALMASGSSLCLTHVGTGAASLNALRKLPIAGVTIPRPMAADSRNSDTDSSRGITQSVVGLAHALGARALADGLPTVDDLSFFAALGCDALQGDAIAGSMPADEVLAWLAKHQEAAKVVEFQRD